MVAQPEARIRPEVIKMSSVGRLIKRSCSVMALEPADARRDGVRRPNSPLRCAISEESRRSRRQPKGAL